MSVYLSVAPPDGFTKWRDSDWERWLREHPWEAAERICSRGSWAIFLFQVRALDPPVYAAVAAFLGFVALAACYVPVRRALQVDPATALRCE